MKISAPNTHLKFARVPGEIREFPPIHSVSSRTLIKGARHTYTSLDSPTVDSWWRWTKSRDAESGCEVWTNGTMLPKRRLRASLGLLSTVLDVAIVLSTVALYVEVLWR